MKTHAVKHIKFVWVVTLYKTFFKKNTHKYIFIFKPKHIIHP